MEHSRSWAVTRMRPGGHDSQLVLPVPVSRVAKSLSVAHVSNIIQQLINGNVATGGVRNGVNNGNNGNNGNATAMATSEDSSSDDDNTKADRSNVIKCIVMPLDKFVC